MRKIEPVVIALALIILIGATLRIVGINWDQNQHLHPDERFLTMVTENLIWPKSITVYFSTSASPANPHNVGFPFYVYGTFPVFVTKSISQVINLHTYNGITLVGRFISASLDVLIIFFVWGISLIIFKNKIIALFSAFFYSLSVLPIQLSHFYAVDTFMVAALYGSFYFLQKYLQACYIDLDPAARSRYIQDKNSCLCKLRRFQYILSGNRA